MSNLFILFCYVVGFGLLWGAYPLLRSPKAYQAAYRSIFILFIGIYLHLHFRASYNFPVPWPDEARLLWKSLMLFKGANLLHAPHFDLIRHICITPGYIFISGIIFNFLGFSFGFARLLSCIFIIASFVLLVFLTRKYGFKMTTMALCGLFLCDLNFVVCGNIARMESLLLFIVTLAFVLLQNKNEYIGLSLLILSPLIHPNGFYFLAAGLIHFLLSYNLRKRRPAKADCVFLFSSASVWLAYAALIISRWDEVSSDMVLLSVSEGGSLLTGINSFFSLGNMLVILFVFICCLYALKNNIQAAFLLFLAVPAWLLTRVRLQMWYGVFNVVSSLMLLILMLHIVYALIKYFFNPRAEIVRRFIVINFVISVIIFGPTKPYLLCLMKNSFSKLSWVGDMHMPGENTYISANDIKRIKAFLYSLPRSHEPIYVGFAPQADALFFADMQHDKIRFVDPIFSSQHPDIYILHTSRQLPSFWHAQKRILAAGVSEADILFKKDTTEIWYQKEYDAVADKAFLDESFL